MSKVQQKNRPRLGRGLSSLISLSELPVEVEVVPPASGVNAERGTLLEDTGEMAHESQDKDSSGLVIPIDKIVPNPHQPRRVFDQAKIAELASSIKSSGLIQPVVVRRAGEGYELIAGERRWRAARLAGLSHVSAIVRDVDAFTQAQMALIENIQREDLNPIDRAQGYRTLIDQLGLTQAELAGRLGEDRSSIANYLRLLELAEPVRNMVRNGELSVGHAKLIAGTPDVLEQERLANLVASQGLSVRNLERLMQDGPKIAPPPSTGAVSAHLQDLEKSLSRQLGMRVQVRSSARKGKGRLVIHYSSLDQFDDLLGRLGVTAE